jgi:RsiW-degrading membrane proteinase PrsW (M82 family)
MDCPNCGAYLIGRDKPATTTKGQPMLKKPWTLPGDEWTAGTATWAGIVGAALVLEKFGLGYDADHPGNRRKWTLSSNALTAGGWDSHTGEPADVRHGDLRRALMVMFLAWLTWHWTNKRPLRTASGK